jgi:23S rRNA (adenine2503-C2)-methyltransferase
MGEPLLNYDAVLRAAKILAHPAGHAIAADAISISTAGVVPAIHRYAQERHPYRLIVSLGAAVGPLRARLMPIERTHDLAQLRGALDAYAATTGGRITLAYVGIAGVNLGPDHARALIAYTRGLRVKVNLIDVNDEPGAFAPPSEDEIRAFRDVLSTAGIPLSRRYAGGKEIGAACGTLAATRQGGEPLAPGER